MKKVMSVLAALLMVFSAYAFDVNGTFGMKQQDSPEGYQQYVGKQFQFRYPSGKLETWEKSGFKLKDEMIPNTYTITKVTVKDIELNGKPNKEITVEAVQDGTVILTMRHCGFKFQRIPGTPNTYFNVLRKSYNKMEDALQD